MAMPEREETPMAMPESGETPMAMREILENGFAALGLDVPAEAVGRFESYYNFLTEKNKVMNLTAVTGEEETARLHFLDCAALLGCMDPSGKRLIDVGTGAGFPGLPLKILRPETELTLLDSLQKRVGFLSETCDLLGFGEVQCIHARAEETPELRGTFDFAVSRAVAKLNVLCELCLPLLRVGGTFLAMKGPEPREEMDEAARAVSVLGGEYAKPYYYDIPGTDVHHSVVIVRKTRETPAKYPRRYAKISKSPL